jgi:Tannase and feruloyl esterase.
VLGACDARDGVKDGVIEDPARCSFDFTTLACSGEDRADCLTRPQVESAQAMASPITDRQSGAVLHPAATIPVPSWDGAVSAALRHPESLWKG